MGTIRNDVERLLTRKRALTYPQIVDAIQAKHPGANTSVKSVAWYASRARADGVEVNVKRTVRH